MVRHLKLVEEEFLQMDYEDHRVPHSQVKDDLERFAMMTMRPWIMLLYVYLLPSHLHVSSGDITIHLKNLALWQIDERLQNICDFNWCNYFAQEGISSLNKAQGK